MEILFKVSGDRVQRENGAEVWISNVMNHTKSKPFLKYMGELGLMK
jgi:hypothetical protein